MVNVHSKLLNQVYGLADQKNIQSHFDSIVPKAQNVLTVFCN